MSAHTGRQESETEAVGPCVYQLTRRQRSALAAAVAIEHATHHAVRRQRVQTLLSHWGAAETVGSALDDLVVAGYLEQRPTTEPGKGYDYAVTTDGLEAFSAFAEHVGEIQKAATVATDGGVSTVPPIPGLEELEGPGPGGEPAFREGLEVLLARLRECFDRGDSRLVKSAQVASATGFSTRAVGRAFGILCGEHDRFPDGSEVATEFVVRKAEHDRPSGTQLWRVTRQKAPGDGAGDTGEPGKEAPATRACPSCDAEVPAGEYANHLADCRGAGS